MGNHQQHHHDEQNGGSSRHGRNAWQDESRDSQGRFQSGNQGSADSGRHDEDDGGSREMRGGREQERGESGREGGRGRYGSSMSSTGRNGERYEADYGYPQSDRGSRWNESDRGRDENGDRGRGDASDGSTQRGRSSRGEETYGSRGRSRSEGHTGQHAGKGPKGYRRSDERVEEDINEALSRHGDIDASEIEVSVKDGDVTLSGTVEDRDTKRRAEECVENCSGVTNVQNNLRVSSSARLDEDRHAGSGSKNGGAGKSSANGSGGNASGGNANSTSGKGNSGH